MLPKSHVDQFFQHKKCPRILEVALENKEKCIFIIIAQRGLRLNTKTQNRRHRGKLLRFTPTHNKTKKRSMNKATLYKSLKNKTTNMQCNYNYITTKCVLL